MPLAGVPVQARDRNICADWCSRDFASRSASRWRIPKVAKGIVGAKWSRRSRRAPRSPTICSTARATTSSVRSACAGRGTTADGSRHRRRRRLHRRAATDRSRRRSDARRRCSRESRRARCSCRAASDVRAAHRDTATARWSRSATAGSSTTRLGARGSRAAVRRARRSTGSASSDATRQSIGAAGALLRYLRELQPGGVPHLARPMIERPGGAMPLDEMTRRNLELVESLRAAEPTRARCSRVLDRTLTPMGARLLRQWLLAPLVERAAIEARLDAVAALVRDPIARAALRDALDGVRDIERLGGKAAAGRATPRELARAGRSLARLPAVERAAARRWPRRARIGAMHDAVGRVRRARRRRSLDDAGGAATRRDRRRGDDRARRRPGARRAARRCATAARTPSRRSRPRNVRAPGSPRSRSATTRCSGTSSRSANANRHLVPADYQRRQTLTGGERYVTPALKEYEEKVLTAAERIETRERELFDDAAQRDRSARSAGCSARRAILAELDVLAALADVAAREGYVRPTIDRRLRPRDRGRASSRRRADDAARQVHPERRRGSRDDARLDHPHRPEHGG